MQLLDCSQNPACSSSCQILKPVDLNLNIYLNSRFDKMPSNWTHLVSFIAQEDRQIHLGQLVDTSRDVGLDSVNNVPIKVYLVLGTIFDGTVTDRVLTVHQVRSIV